MKSVLLLDVARETKTTLTRAVHEKLKMENAKRAKGMKGVKAAGERHIKSRRERKVKEREKDGRKE